MAIKKKAKVTTPKGKKKVGTVLHEFKAGNLRSGSKKGPKVTKRKQAIAIALSEGEKVESKPKKKAAPRKKKKR